MASYDVSWIACDDEAAALAIEVLKHQCVQVLVTVSHKQLVGDIRTFKWKASSCT
jgi:hypothetical protein